jgi:hypothetical protein
LNRDQRAAHRPCALIICHARAALESWWVDRGARRRSDLAAIAVAIIIGDATPSASGVATGSSRWNPRRGSP